MDDHATDGRELRGNPNGLSSLAKYSKLPIERIRYYPNADANVVRAIGRGILFQIAFWSGPAFAAFAKLTETISKLDTEGILEFVVVDIDGLSALSAVSEFLGGVRGAGETAWIRNGFVMVTNGLGFNVECFARYTKSLLEMA
jgi:hypothetical protein